ncbi:peptidoglycan DD-metalloendopeptidase family protein [Vogesella sp. LIG4]|uniref:M23 family metallopeptidase n=1 Tax=Vogesella sp. LIG4 TaxID=1192162 RepID=UPI00081FAD9A|nr:peptidoglycan DD-metalloendopeptidase family protein [Vogesella sp. LIG4]SCK25383.1 Murein DD-endopeptidase MepM and murein hydrolase activator NlpD, contain LysM domain [Vogesella sp. LIG4]
MDYRKLLHLPQKWTNRVVNSHATWLGAVASLPFLGVLTAVAVTQGNAPEAALPVQQQVVEALTLPPLPQPASNTVRYWRDEAVQRGDTIASLLNRLGVRDSDATGFIYSSPLSKDLLKLKTGATLSVQLNDQGELFGLRFLNDDENGEKVLVDIEKAGNGWRASADAPHTEAMQTVRALQINSTAASALGQAGIPDEIRTQLGEIFSDQFDLSSLKHGDKIDLVYETLLYNGAPLTTGNILAVEIDRGGSHYQAYYFAHDSESGSYYDAQGKALKKGFSKIPVAGSHISSGFGMRYHPVLHALRMHEGIDYAASTGTPIMAPSDAVVETVARQNGYGNVVILRHNARLSTLYAHMSRFRSGLKPGEQVKAGEVIGYVGATGRATGPHLHMEVHINGQPVDPATTALPTRELSSSERLAFTGQSVKLAANLKLLRDIPVSVAQLD